MKLLVKWSKTTEYFTEIEVESLEAAKPELEKLTHDDFAETDEYNHVEIEDQTGEDVTGLIQPRMRLG